MNSYLEGPSIEIRVGQDEDARSFSVHKDLITSRSDFFATMFRGTWKEIEQGVVNLPEDEPDIFKLYLNILYYGIIPVRRMVEVFVDPDDPDNDEIKSTETITQEVRTTASEEWRELCSLYILCEKLQDTTAKNLIIDAIIDATRISRADGTNQFPIGTNVELLYDGTRPGSPIRKLLVDFYVHAGSATWVEGNDSLPAEFLQDALIQMMKRKKEAKSDSPLHYASNYHEGPGKQGKKESTASSKSE